MKRQFRQEEHNRQDKAKRADYQDEMRLKGPTYARCPDLARLTSNHEPPLALESIRRAKEYEVARIRRCLFVLGGHQFKLGWPEHRFAKVNGLVVGDPTAKQVYQRIKAAARADMKTITVAIMEAGVHRVQTFTKRFGRFALSNLRVARTVEGLQCDEFKQT